MSSEHRDRPDGRKAPERGTDLAGIASRRQIWLVPITTGDIGDAAIEAAEALGDGRPHRSNLVALVVEHRGDHLFERSLAVAEPR